MAGALLGCQSSTTPPELVLPFWAGPDVSSSGSVVAIDEHHACSGRIAWAAVARISSLDDSEMLVPELVVEFDRSGEVVRRWPTPVEPYVVAIDADEIWIRNPEPVSTDVTLPPAYLAIRPDGSFRRVPDPIPSGPKSIECPPLPEFGATAYLRCWLYADRETSAERRLGYQGPCT